MFYHTWVSLTNSVRMTRADEDDMDADPALH
jgi:hypothetical protein